MCHAFSFKWSKQVEAIGQNVTVHTNGKIGGLTQPSVSFHPAQLVLQYSVITAIYYLA